MLSQKFIFFLSFFLSVAACYSDQAAVVTPPRSVTCLDEEYEIPNLCEDEKEYLDWARGYRPELKFSDLTGEDYKGIVQTTKDVDKAAALFYQRLIADPRNRSFLNQIKAIERRDSEKRSQSGAGLLLAVAPGMFYKDNKGEVDATGASLRSIARELGMAEAIIPTEQTGTVQQNGHIICEYVENIQKSKKVSGLIIASASKGSSDMKMAIRECGRQPWFRVVRGWINMGGILNGSRLVDYILNNPSAYWRARYYFWRKGYDWDGLRSMRHGEDAPLSGPVDIPSGMTVINIVGVPLFRHVTTRARPFYLAMVPQGPSDGIILLSEAYIPGTITYASFRNDHYFQWPVPESRIRAFLIYLINQARLVSR
ncbi:hypothetical protein [Leptonema illini]|uniref:Lipoprotein n=1 Tax=Leptonema illini DSM 21528 TaxID=929563 RepID=H2CHY5_9LEPT|nr:hypothetical protein [Leptonema illini]EHQ07007.1 hypothetical protein Lepil_2331 [Leptonema illini DSM 21528]